MSGTGKKTIVEFQDVVKTYGEGEALQYANNHVSFTIEEGEFVVILGQSGAGKSTVLNMLSGMDLPTSGKVLIDGEEVSAMNDKQLSDFRARKIGFIFQFYNLIPSLTVRENVALTKSIVKDAADPDEMLAAVGLTNHKDKFPSQLSGGAQVDLFLMKENEVDTPYLIEGEDFNPDDTDGVWIANAFAKKRDLHVGDAFTIEYNGVTFTKTIRGLVESVEYEFRQADGDADTYLENITMAYMSYDAFPVREYVTHLIKQEKITAADIRKHADTYQAVLDKLDEYGMSVDDLSQDMLLTLVEKLPFWNKLTFQAQYNLRDVSRSKLRAFMSIIETAVGMLLMLYGVGCNELVPQMENLMFEKSTVSEYQVKLSADASLSEVNAMQEELGGELVMIDQIEVSKVQNPTTDEKKKQTITVIEGKGLYNILDLDNNITSIKPGTVSVSRKLSETMKIHVGDTIYWHLYSKNTWYEAKVGAIYRNSDTQGIAFLKEDFEKTGATYTPTLLMTDNKNAESKKTLSYVSGVNNQTEMKEAYEKGMEVMSIMIFAMIIFSAVLVVTVLYNSGSLSFNERIKEFATLKVLGMQSAKIRRMLSRQNFWLSLIGIVLGAPLGNMTLNAMMNSNGENYDYMLKVPAFDYVLAGAFVLVISVLVSFLFAKRIKKLDMIEVLKGVE